MDYHERVAALIQRRPTAVHGLKFFPDMEPALSNDQDMPPYGWISSIEVSDCNLAVVRDAVRGLGPHLAAVMEIGVNRNGERSMSRVLMDERPTGSFYLGVDLDDKSYLDDHAANTHTMRCSSHEQSRIRDYLRNHGVHRLDLLFIDGWHSVNTCVNDWLYADLLSDHGVVILHDTNSHPGCVGLYQAVDEELWTKERHCTENDFGIATFRRKHGNS